MERNELETLIATLGIVDHQQVEWERVRWTAYLIHQHLRYEYPGRIHDLRQRLIIVPPGQHGGQRLVAHKLEVSVPGIVAEESRDRFGNLILNLTVPEIERAIDFTAWIVVERAGEGNPAIIASDDDTAATFRAPSSLTMPDGALRAAAATLQAGERDPVALATRINAWVYARMRYEHGATTVKTTAAEALKLGRGVCQDYAHVMLALCRLCNLSARYVSGHLLGEGGSHAWVEVLLPDPERQDRYHAHPFDPTHGSRPGHSYITVAVGRDYSDVTPTSGSFRAPYGGRLSTRKRAGITAVEYLAS